MSRRNAILGELRGTICALAEQNKATAIALTGSTARGEDSDSSDCDFLVEMAPGSTLFNRAGLLCDLEDLLGCEVDVVNADQVKPGYEQLFEDALLL